MTDSLAVLLDQNIPRPIINWLKAKRPSWTVHHVCTVGLDHKGDEEIFEWAQQHRAIVVTYDEDFADQRSFPVGTHYGVIRLRVWPTTIEETQYALGRLLSTLSDNEIQGSLIIIDRERIRLRRQSPLFN